MRNLSLSMVKINRYCKMSLLGKKGSHTHIVENLKSKIDFNIYIYSISSTVLQKITYVNEK